MSKYAVMPLSDYVGACDSIREKTGASDVIKSSELTQQINNVFEAGKAQGGEVDFIDVSFVELYENGKLTVDNRRGQDSYGVAENTLSAEEAIFNINMSGYVEFEGTTSHSYDENTISVDGVYVYFNEEGNNLKFSFKGNVTENISIYASLCTYTFDRFIIRKDYDKGYDDGKQAEYDNFWDAYQSRGNRVHYNTAFGGGGWNDTTYKPKYPFGKVTYANNMYATSYITDTLLPIDFTNASSALTSVFTGSPNLKTIRTLTVKETTTFSSAFISLPALENIEFKGTIGKSGISFSGSKKLTAKSLLSILTALSKDSAVASGKSITFATASQTIIEADTQCLEQLTLARNAGWTVAFA